MFSTYGSRKVGDIIDGVGTIEQVSLTAYRVGSVWVPFIHVDHAPREERLVVFGGEWSL